MELFLSLMWIDLLQGSEHMMNSTQVLWEWVTGGTSYPGRALERPGDSYRPSINDVRTKSRKIDPPCPKNVRTGSTLFPPCPCGHTINFEKSEVFCAKKCGRTHLKKSPPPCPQNVRTRQALPPVHCGRLLWSALNATYFSKSSYFLLINTLFILLGL